MKKQEKNEINQLFEEFKSGNKEVLEEIYNKYQKVIFGIAFGILKNKDDAEDIVQLVFIKLHTLDNSKLPENNIPSWLYTITKNETLQFLRKQKNNIDLDSIYDLEAPNSEINKLIAQETYNKLISNLSSKEKEIVSLKIISNLSFEQISEILGEKTGTIKWRYYKAIYNLKLILSNLSMSIVAFIIGLATFKQAKSSPAIEQDVTNNQISKPQGTIGEDNDEELKSELQETQNTTNQFQDNTENTIIEEPDNTENIIIEEPIVHQHLNYVGVGFLGISFIFFIATIVIILKKY
ncbi:MAG: sigma-70 family RNA polymerase sigma factor [Clostridia bacterium]|nr:sigma-70 family RNA polymerase sigma factor [Clostridia bacterium]